MVHPKQKVVDEIKRPLSVALVGLLAKQPVQPSRGLAIESLAAHIRRKLPADTKISLWDLQYTPLSEVVEEISNYKPDWLGLSIPIGALRSADLLIDGIRLRGISPKLVIGNLIATNATMDLAAHFPEALIVIGEGEIPLEGILRAAIEGTDPIDQGVPGLARMTRDGNYQSTTLEHDTVFGGWAEDLWDCLFASQAQVLVEASRGCLGNCTFCSTRNLHPYGWRGRPIEDLFKEIDCLYQRGARWIFFVDDDFVGQSWPRAIQISERIGREFPGLTFGISLRADSLVSKQDEQNLERMTNHGLTKVLLGLESGSNEQLKRFHKRARIETNAAAVQILQSAPMLDFSIGFLIDPLMKVEELRESVQFIRGRNLEAHVSHPLGLVEVHKGSQFEHLTIEAGVTKSFDLNSLSWSWRFQDEEVDRIVTAVSALDQCISPLIEQLTQLHRLLTRAPQVDRKLIDQIPLLFGDISKAKLIEFEALEYYLAESSMKNHTIPSHINDCVVKWAINISNNYADLYPYLVDLSDEVICKIRSLPIHHKGTDYD